MEDKEEEEEEEEEMQAKEEEEAEEEGEQQWCLLYSSIASKHARKDEMIRSKYPWTTWRENNKTKTMQLFFHFFLLSVFQS